jgi:protein-tyrosine phosphatase
LLLDYATDSLRQGKSITDPWYSGNFVETYRDVVIGCEGFLAYLENI